jgi:hypothetical protein
MRIKFLFIALFVSVTVFCQIPEDFRILKFENADSSLVVLNRIARQQYKPVPIYIQITMEYIAQNRIQKKFNAWTGNVRCEEKAHSVYYENISNITVKKLSVWKIYFKSDVTGQSDLFILNDKEMAEEAYAALLCLIRNSGNKNFPR